MAPLYIFTVRIIAYFWIQCSTSADFVCYIVIFNLVSFHCNSLILINHAVIFVCTDAVPFLKVTLSSMLGITILGLHSLVVHVIGE